MLVIEPSYGLVVEYGSLDMVCAEDAVADEKSVVASTMDKHIQVAAVHWSNMWGMKLPCYALFQRVKKELYCYSSLNAVVRCDSREMLQKDLSLTFQSQKATPTASIGSTSIELYRSSMVAVSAVSAVVAAVAAVLK